DLAGHVAATTGAGLGRRQVQHRVVLARLPAARRAQGRAVRRLRWLGQLAPAAGTVRGQDEAEAGHGAAQTDLVARLQVVFRQRQAGTLRGRLVPFALANLLAVDEGAVEAAEVADADVRRVDVEQAVVAGDLLMVAVVRQPRLAVPRPAEQAGGP